MPCEVDRNRPARFSPAATPLNGKIGHDAKTARIQARRIVVHANQDFRKFTIRAGLRIRHGERRPVVVAHPAVAALVRMRRIVIEIDRAAEIDPADYRAAVFVGERIDFDFLPVRALIRSRHGFGRRHGMAVIIQVGPVAVLLRVCDRPVPLASGYSDRRELSRWENRRSSNHRFGGPESSRPAGCAAIGICECSARHFDCAMAVVNDRLVAEFRVFIHRQPIVSAGNRLIDILTMHRRIVVEH